MPSHKLHAAETLGTRKYKRHSESCLLKYKAASPGRQGRRKAASIVIPRELDQSPKEKRPKSVKNTKCKSHNGVNKHAK